MEFIVQAIAELIQGTFDASDIANILLQNFPYSPQYHIMNASQKIMELHCCGNGYDISDIENILKNYF